MIAVGLALQVLVAAGVAALFGLSRGASLFHPLAVYLAFHVLVFVVRPLLVHVAGFDTQWVYMGFRPDPETFVRTLAVASLGLLCFAAASLWAGRTPAAARNPGPLAFSPGERQAFHLVAAGLLPLALYAAWLDLRIFGLVGDAAGAAAMVRDDATGNTVFVGTSAYLVKAHNLLVPLTVLFVAVHRFRWWAYAPFLLVLGYRLYLSSRWGVIVACAILLLLVLHRHRARWLRPRALLLAIPVLLLFHAVGQDRAAFRELIGLAPAAPAAAAGEHALLGRLDGPDFANFDYLAYIVAVVPERSNTHTYFSQYLALATHPIPRVLWPGKPVGLPVRLVDLNAHGRFQGRTWSLPGDGWLSLGWIGVAVTLAAAGAGLGRAHRVFQAHRDHAFVVVAYCAFLPVAILWFRGGLITSVARIGMWMLLPILLWWLLSRLFAWLARRRARALPDGRPEPGR